MVIFTGFNSWFFDGGVEKIFTYLAVTAKDLPDLSSF